jgi:hypothetical protein
MTRQAGAPAAGRFETVGDASALTSVLAHAHVFEPAPGVRLVEEYAGLLSAVEVFRLVFDHAPGGAAELARSVASWMRTSEQEAKP